MAKRDLKAGDQLDGIGGFCSYGLVDNTSDARAGLALPIGLSAGRTLRHDVAKDSVITLEDVDATVSTPVESLWREQNERWPQTVQTRENSLLQLESAAIPR
jgi:predicted homoserine dehydrogenase-like protein